MSFTFTCEGKCPRCGKENFTSRYVPADFAPVTCLSCGEITTVKIALATFQGREPEPCDKRASVTSATNY